MDDYVQVKMGDEWGISDAGWEVLKHPPRYDTPKPSVEQLKAQIAAIKRQIKRDERYLRVATQNEPHHTK